MKYRKIIINADEFFDGTSVHHDSSIIIDKGIITNITYGKFLSRTNYEILEAKFVMPGLVSSHEHIVGVGIGKMSIVTPAYNALNLFLMHGVLGLREAGNTIEQITRIRGLSKNTSLPYIVFSGPLIETGISTFMTAQVDNENYRNIIDSLTYYRDCNLKFIKIYVSNTLDLYKKIVRYAKSKGFKVGAHLWSVPLEEALEYPYYPDIIDHISTIIPRKKSKVSGFKDLAEVWADDFDQGWAEETAKKIKSKGIGVSTTLITIARGWRIWNDIRENLLDYIFYYNRFVKLTKVNPFFHLFKKRMPEIAASAGYWDVDKTLARRAWRNLVIMAKILYEEGVPLLPGSDSPNARVPPGEGFIKELLILNKEVNIPQAEVLRYATSITAKFVGLHELGSIREKSKPNIILLEESPLADIRNLYRISTIITGNFILKPTQIELYPLEASVSMT